MKLLKKYRNIALRIMDIIIIAIAYYIAAILIENKLWLNNEINNIVLNTVILAVLIYGGILQIFSTYKNITRYENGSDYLVYILACVISCTIMIFLNIVSIMPIAEVRINLIAALIIVTSIIGYRVCLRMLLTEIHGKKENVSDKKKVLIIGAGEAAKILIKTIKTSLKDAYNIIGLIDDNTNKVNKIKRINVE